MSASSSLFRRVAKLSSRRLAQTTTSNASRVRSYASAEVASGATTTDYESPFADFFDMMKEGRSSLGTTDDTPVPPERLLKCGVNEEALRFRTMHYGRTQLAPHIQPGEHRVTLKVNMEDIPLNDVEKDIVKQIVGDRVNEERGELRLASDQFGSRIENKRHLVSMLDRIVLSAKRLAKELEDERQQESEDEKR